MRPALHALALGAALLAGAAACKPEADLVVDVARLGPPIERALNGRHVHDERPGPEFVELGVTSWRRVASAANHLHWSCDDGALDPSSVAEYHDWLDAVQATGLEPFLALSYVPECLAEGAHPKAPPRADRADDYARYLAAFLDELVTRRIAQGKRPLRYLEAWNEPDIPFDGGNVGHGHGWVGTLDDYEARVFLPLARAVAAVETANGVDVELGAPPSFDSRPLLESYPSFAELMAAGGVAPAAAALLGPIAERVFDTFYPGGFLGAWGRGGFLWADRTTAAADREGLEVDFVSWHHYVQNPFEGPGPGCSFPDFLTFLHQRNPRASAAEYLTDAVAWADRYPGRETWLTEWGLSAGCDDRPLFEVGAFEAAALVAMQQGGLDGAVGLGFPAAGPQGTVHGMFAALGERTVASVLAEDPAESGVWALAAVDPAADPTAAPDRTTLLAAQWHSLAEDAAPRVLSATVASLPAGAYEVRVHRMDHAHPGSTVPDEVLELVVTAGVPAPIAIPLDGQAAAFVEILPAPAR